MTGSTAVMALLSIRDFGSMTSSTGQSSNGGCDAMGRGRLMLRSTVTRSTSAWVLGGNDCNNRRIRALMTGSTAIMALFSIAYLSSMTSRTGQSANCGCNTMGRSRLMLTRPMTGSTSRRILRDNGIDNFCTSTLVTGRT